MLSLNSSKIKPSSLLSEGYSSKAKASLNFISVMLFLGIGNAIGQVSVTAEFPGGNVVVDSIVKDTVYFRPDLQGTAGEWFYWNFEAVSQQSKKWYFKANQNNILTTLGAASSLDRGRNWEWIDQRNNLGPNKFSYPFKRNQTVRLSMGQPYTENDFKEFISNHLNNKNLELSYLTTTNNGRQVEKIRIGSLGSSPKYKILITARHHSSEMMTSYIVEGMIDVLMSGDHQIIELLKTTAFLIIPFVDKDGVEEGDQGKNRKPRDHNRDYSGKSIYNTTRAIRALKDSWIGASEWIAIDLHDPWIKGPSSERLYIVGNESHALAAEQQKFVHILDNTLQRDSMSISKVDYLKWGESWNIATNTEKGNTFIDWAGSFYKDGLLLATTVEFPYAISKKQPVDAALAKDFGKVLVYSLKEYLEKH